MRKIIKGKVFDTTTAEYMCGLTCTAFGGDFEWHDTDLYRTAKGQWFMAGEGNGASMWGREGLGGGRIPGKGIRLLSDDEALRVLESEDMDDLIEEFFDVSEG